MICRSKEGGGDAEVKNRINGSKDVTDGNKRTDSTVPCLWLLDGRRQKQVLDKRRMIDRWHGHGHQQLDSSWWCHRERESEDEERLVGLWRCSQPLLLCSVVVRIALRGAVSAGWIAVAIR